MYSVMAVAAGFAFSVCMFAVGAGTAVYLIAIEPQQGQGQDGQASAGEVADLWTATPRTIRSPEGSLDRLQPGTGSSLATFAVAPDTAAHSAPILVADNGLAETDASPSAIVPQPPSRPPIDILSQHVAWCFDRYRSYRTEDDSYTAYSGDRRACVSPYTDELVAWAEQPSPELTTAYLGDNSAADRAKVDYRFQHAMRGETLGDAIVRGADAVELFYASANVGTGRSDDHVSKCFARYRSYRAEDNSYQPYGGGSRRQCD